MPVDLLYVAHNRLEFTKATFRALLENTDWDLVSQLLIADDASTDGTAEWLGEQLSVTTVPTAFNPGPFQGPVAALNWALDRQLAPMIAKVDNDTIVPPGWLRELVTVMSANPDLDILGAESGFGGPPESGPVDRRAVEPASHIGGIGVIRSRAFERSGCRPNADGRWGWTEWQHAHPNAVRGWITPPLLLFQLDQVPVEPWLTLAKEYVAAGWQRRWEPYPREHEVFWSWFTDKVTA